MPSFEPSYQVIHGLDRSSNPRASPNGDSLWTSATNSSPLLPSQSSRIFPYELVPITSTHQHLKNPLGKVDLTHKEIKESSTSATTTMLEPRSTLPVSSLSSYLDPILIDASKNSSPTKNLVTSHDLSSSNMNFSTGTINDGSMNFVQYQQYLLNLHHVQSLNSVNIPKKISLYKTELCRSFEETGFCRYGLKCQFAHDPSELRTVPRHPRYKTEICRTFWENGNCPYGKRCCFIHLEAGALMNGQPPGQGKIKDDSNLPFPLSKMSLSSANEVLSSPEKTSRLLGNTKDVMVCSNHHYATTIQGKRSSLPLNLSYDVNDISKCFEQTHISDDSGQKKNDPHSFKRSNSLSFPLLSPPQGQTSNKLAPIGTSNISRTPSTDNIQHLNPSVSAWNNASISIKYEPSILSNSFFDSSEFEKKNLRIQI